MLDNIVSETIDILVKYLQKKENKEKIQENIIDPIIKEVSTRLGKYIFVMFVAYIVILILIIYILCTLLSSRT